MAGPVDDAAVVDDLDGLTRDELFERESDYSARADAAHLAGERAEEDAWQRRLELVQARMDRLDAEVYTPSPRIVDRYIRARVAARTGGFRILRGPRRRGAGRPAARRTATRASRDGPDGPSDEPGDQPPARHRRGA